MKILFADALDESRLGRLRDAGHDCVVDAALTADTLPGAIGDADVLVVRSTKVTAATIDAGTGLGLVVRAGAGTDNIDQAAASARGVYVANVPGRNAVAVAELTLGLLLAIDRRIADNVADLRAGTWDKSRYTKADGIAGKRLAIVGVGQIGLAVAERAQAFGMTVTVERKPGRSAEIADRIRDLGIRTAGDLPTLLERADVVSIHVPGGAATRHLVNDEFLTHLPDGAIVLNTSRGDVVDEDALRRALDQRGLRAGLDVWADEPGTGQGEFHSDLARHPSVVGTHHIGASTRQAQEAIAEGTVEVIERYAAGEVINCVNLRSEITGTHHVVVRHLDRVGVLAQVFEVLRSAGLNVQQMENAVFAGGEAAVATIHLAGEPAAEVVAELSAIDEVLAVDVG